MSLSENRFGGEACKTKARGVGHTEDVTWFKVPTEAFIGFGNLH